MAGNQMAGSGVVRALRTISRQQEMAESSERGSCYPNTKSSAFSGHRSVASLWLLVEHWLVNPVLKLEEAACTTSQGAEAAAKNPPRFDSRSWVATFEPSPWANVAGFLRPGDLRMLFS